MATVEIDRFRDTSTELKLIAYVVRKDHRVCGDMDRDLFSIKAYKLFFDIVSSHKTTMPKDIMKDSIRDRVRKPELVNPYFIKLYKVRVDNISQKNIKSMVAKLKKVSFLRLSLEMTEDLVTLIDEGKDDEVRKAAKKIALLGSGKKRVYAGEYLEDAEERESIIKARRMKKDVGIPTGIRLFDKATGGVMNGELAILAGETGIGKSIALENFGVHAWLNDLNVLYFSIEMTKTTIQFRIDSRLTGLKYMKFRLGDFDDKDLLLWKKEIRKLKAIKDNYFEIICLPRGCTSLDIESEAERIQDVHGQKLDLIIVDYLNIMNPNGIMKIASKDWQAQSLIASELKELAVDFRNEGIAIWTGNQVTDEGEGKSFIRKKHIKYGRGIVEVANIVVALVQSQDDKLEDVMKLQMIKLRDVTPISPITIRPNFDIMILNSEMRALGHGDMKRWKKRQ